MVIVQKPFTKIDEQIRHLNRAFEHNFVLGDRDFERSKISKFKCLRGRGGGALKPRIEQRIMVAF